MIEKLKSRWNLQSGKQVVVVLLVFALTGTTVLLIKKPISVWLGISSETPIMLRVIFSLLIILPIYQVVLLAYGALFGQFHFFWEFEKKMFGRIFLQKKSSSK